MECPAAVVRRVIMSGTPWVDFASRNELFQSSGNFKGSSRLFLCADGELGVVAVDGNILKSQQHQLGTP